MILPPVFDGFVGIDWSGARAPGYDGIAVARCQAGTGAAPALVPPPGRRWTRQAVLDWLADHAGQRLLVGLDFAFSLPWTVAAGYFAGDSAGAADLWALVERVCATAPDLFGGDFARHPDYAAGFWHHGPQPADLPRRATERACRTAGLGTPDSPYKLIGAKQVGKGGLAGMRLIHALRGRHPPVTVWPMEPNGTALLLVEIYPRLFLKQIGWGNRKVRTQADLTLCLERLGSEPAAAGRLSDHDTDALVTAAGLRAIAGNPALWDHSALTDTARQCEGWIFGLPAGPAPRPAGASRPQTPFLKGHAHG